MKRILSGYLLAAALLPLSGGAYATMVNDVTFSGNVTFEDAVGVAGFAETIRLESIFFPLLPGAGAAAL